MKIVFMGTPEAAVPSLKRILADGHEVVEVWTQPDRPSGRGRRLTASPVKEFAESSGIPVFQPVKIKSLASRERFRSLNADVAVVVAYGRILTKTYLEAFPFGCINVHFSLLPKYRGAAPVNWAIANDEKVTGVTTMKMDAGLDTGDILISRETGIGENETAIELMSRLSVFGADVLSETLTNLEDITPMAQDDSGATFAPMFDKNDGVVDWSMDSKTIANRIRAFQPFPKSFSFVAGNRITFWKGIPVEETSVGKAGEVLNAFGDELLVCCGGGSVLKIEELQIAGKSRVNAREFLNGINLSAGDVFGNE